MPDENGDKTFVRITNRDIYNKLDCLEKKVDTVIKDTESNKENIKTNRKSIWWLWTSIGGIAIGVILTALKGVF
ncbi:MAG TPA: hypothetical protein ENG70_02310 [Candidatus Cloacimonetes bacterium]|nr:hypothetical protein [Candidatus Cloacimonadota bacterium]HEX37679.1 hypothetical protein [Candidatus Cloacimonadota bacterium]